MIKIVTNEDLGDMSEWLTPACQNEPCSNCHEVKLAVKTGDIRQFCRLTHYPLEESKAGISACRQCMWFWVDQVEELDEEQPLTLEELRNMAGQWVWVEVQYEHNKCDGWAFISTPVCIAYLDKIMPLVFSGKKFVAYRHRPEETP